MGLSGTIVVEGLSIQNRAICCMPREASRALEGVSGWQGVNHQRPYVAGAVPAEGLVSRMEPRAACPEPQSKHQGASGCQGVNQ